MPQAATIREEAEEVAAEQDQRDEKHDREQRRRHVEHASQDNGDGAADDEEHSMADDRATRFSICDLERREFSDEFIRRSCHQVIFAFNTRFEMLASATAAEILPSWYMLNTTLSIRHIPSFTPVSIVLRRPVDLPSRIRF